MMTKKAILDQLDACARGFAFPMLDNGYVYPVDQRMHIMRSDTMWMIIIEAVGFSPRAGGIDGVQNCLHLFGSDLHRAPGTANEDFLNPFDFPQESVFDPEYLWEVNPSLDHIMIRGQRVPVDLRPQILAAKGIELIEPPKIDPPALLRSLVPEYRDLLLATPDEIAQRNPLAIPTYLVLDEWNHPDVCSEQLPSRSETFQMLASLIETGRLDEYQPTLPHNTHWSNWPEGGTL
jgi:hypothetical protein